jgi:hypothetical protein
VIPKNLLFPSRAVFSASYWRKVTNALRTCTQTHTHMFCYAGGSRGHVNWDSRSWAFGRPFQMAGKSFAWYLCIHVFVYISIRVCLRLFCVWVSLCSSVTLPILSLSKEITALLMFVQPSLSGPPLLTTVNKNAN